MRLRIALLASTCVMSVNTSYALDLEFGDFEATWDNRVTLGAAWRMEERDNALLAKLNVPGQQGLCDPDDCISTTGDTGPVKRLVEAEGGFSLTNTDNGNMNYDQYDMVAGLVRVDTKLSFAYKEIYGKVTGIGYFDDVNEDFDETHFNTRWQAKSSKRNRRIEKRFAKNAELREYFVGTAFAMPWLGDRDLNISVGNQRLRWGEANLHLFNTLDFINPLDAGLARMPGLDLSSINTPVGLVIFGTELTDTAAVEFFYQYKWEAVRPDPSGSLLATNDTAGSGEYAILGLGQFSEDPDKQFISNGATSLISSATRTLYPEDEDFGFPDDGGQYGVKLSWYAEKVLGGTEFGFFFANYHSRLPYASTFAGDASCTQDAAIPGNFASAFIACNGFNGSANASGMGGEPFPVDTMRVFLDYPEDIKHYGVSFNSKLGNWSLAGEYSFFDDQPIQILQSDLVFASLQYSAPPEDLPIGPLAFSDPLLTALPSAMSDVVANLAAGFPPEGNLVFPSARSVFPDLLSAYRGHTARPGEYVPGYERVQMGQLVITGLRLFSASNPIKADQIIWLVEAGLTHVLDMPNLNELAFQGAGDFTHPSPGSDGSGQPKDQPVNTLSINPHQQTEGFAEDFSWGMRTLMQATYNDVFSTGINIMPTVIWFEDISGISPAPLQNYVEGRRLIIPGLFFDFSQALSASILYQYHDGERTNLLRDRDNLSMSFSYNF